MLWRRAFRFYAAAQFGFVRRRNRHHVVLLVRLARRRILELGLHSLVAFYDQVNAFPSTEWSELHSTTQQYADEDDLSLLCQHFRSPGMHA
jgi:hypothetical protein